MSVQEQLIGTWVSDPEDVDGIRELGRATLEFEEDGQLTYTAHAVGKDQKMFLTFRTEGGTLVTDQPSSPRQERTAYSIGSDGKLTLWFGSRRSVYIRED
jgi:hypothetical protein